MLVKITGTTNKLMPDGKTYYELKLRIDVKNTDSSTLKKALSRTYPRRQYGRVINVTYTNA